MLRRTLSLTLSVLALLACYSSAWAGGNKIGTIVLTSQLPCPMTIGGSTTFQLAIQRKDSGKGINGNVTATLSLVGLPAYFNATMSPTTINFGSKEGGKTILVRISAPGSIAGNFPFQVVATRTASDFNTSNVELLKIGNTCGGPTANPDSAITKVNTPVKVDVLHNDTTNGFVTVLVNSDPTHGGVVVNTDGTITYTPATDYVGDDFFGYKITDNAGLFDTAKVSITVGSFPTVPVSPHSPTDCIEPVHSIPLHSGGASP